MVLSNRVALRKSDVREANQRLLLNLIRQNRETSRADIVRITGFSASSVTFIVNRMIRDGLLSESHSEHHAQVGRRPLILRLRPESLVACGVEIARSGARIAIADLNGGILKQRSIQWHPNPQAFLARVRAALRTLTASVPAGRLLGVGVSLSGTTDQATGKVVAAENLGWFDVDAGKILSEGIATPFHFENDAKLRALAERWFCEPGSKPLDNFVFLTMSPGLGTGIIIDGRLFHGSSGEASEFGHTILYPGGRSCVCGGTGCWEEYASQRALERLYAERNPAASQKLQPDTEAIIQQARHGDPVAVEVLQIAATHVGLGCANINAAFNPEAIIVGDYLASAWDLIKDRIWEIMRKQAPHRNLSRLRLIPSQHGRDSALKGALALVLSRFFTGSGSVTPQGATVHAITSRRSA